MSRLLNLPKKLVQRLAKALQILRSIDKSSGEGNIEIRHEIFDVNQKRVAI